MVKIVQYISTAIAFVSIAIIVYGIIRAIIDFLRNETGNGGQNGLLRIRSSFGSYLLLSLEFLIGADIIKTVMDPTYEELIILAGIVVLRTILSYFLNKETKALDA